MAGLIRKAAAGLCLGAALLAASPVANAQSTLTRTSSFAYDATSGLLTQEVIEPDTPALKLQSDYTYNSFGQKTQVTVSGADIATRSATTTFSANGQFPASAANALGQAESWTYDARFGLPVSHTGPNGLTTTWSYDGFGRKTGEVRADGTRTSLIYAYCAGTQGSTIDCATTSGVTLVAKLVTDAAGNRITPNTIDIFDKLGRPILTMTDGFDGSTVLVATEYNGLGQVLRKSQPYFRGATPLWTTFTYDALGRVTSSTAPDGSVDTRAYHGLTTSATNALNQTSTTLKDSQGNTQRVTDAQGGTTSYLYDAYGNMTKVTDAAGNITTASYDVRGRKIASSDPDAGAGSATYDVLNQPKTATNAAGETTSFTYDLLGRPTQRTAPDLVATWTYDSGTAGIGKLATAATNTGYSRAHTYDALGRPTVTQLTISGTSYTTTASYDAASRLSKVTYPSGFRVRHDYNWIGFQTTLTDDTSGQVYWTAQARDASLRLTQAIAGNGISTANTYDPNTGLLTDTSSGTSGAVQHFTYTYDVLGKLLSRADAGSSFTETFGYDSLNRLTSATVNLSPTPLLKTVAYNAIGNITAKSDVGAYSYPVAGQARPHAVTSISAGAINTSFTYDAKGNMTSGNGVGIAYTSYNKPASISRGSNTLTFQHDAELNRYLQTSASGTTLYMSSAGVAAEKITGSGGTVQWNNYLVAAGGLIGVEIERSDTTGAMVRYFHKDHLGSVTTITNEAGAVVERLSYDAWGKRRYANGTDDTAGAITSQTTKGFTEHEMLDSVGLVHMNGRVFDPLVARFGSPDPMTESPFSTQGWNRYSYVGNSPLNFTDPSGYCFMGCFWNKAFSAIGSLFRKVPILGTLLQIAAAAVCSPIGLSAVCGAAAAAFVAGVTSGKLGNALKAGLISALTYGAFSIGTEAISSALASTAGAEAIAASSSGASACGCNYVTLDSGPAENLPEPLAGNTATLTAPVQLQAVTVVGTTSTPIQVAGNTFGDFELPGRIYRDLAGIASNFMSDPFGATEYYLRPFPVTNVVGAGVAGIGAAARFARSAIQLHHAWPMYLGGPAKQVLVPLEREIHSAYHSGLDKWLSRSKGTAYYDSLSEVEKQAAMRKLLDYTKNFDGKEGTNLLDALIQNRFFYK